MHIMATGPHTGVHPRIGAELSASGGFCSEFCPVRCWSGAEPSGRTNSAPEETDFKGHAEEILLPDFLNHRLFAVWSFLSLLHTSTCKKKKFVLVLIEINTYLLFYPAGSLYIIRPCYSVDPSTADGVKNQWCANARSYRASYWARSVDLCTRVAAMHRSCSASSRAETYMTPTPDSSRWHQFAPSGSDYHRNPHTYSLTCY
ncbi:uncharacterized protein EI90DRAFT_1678602 [Cantharellus anzutake]|uniref:uncharacterized protein n=1 Tax=Cantharellus anzutake TaxID=1750568 RepID=UPI001904925F|nr:uncharacterized protein EI90DRAFT_1678602 [Cantharellus anzutake]KAF8327731.1 hypothetical protein EI90DRAFT_1678602 [Cantharellus anzutake]